jgi:hypothetical protein
MRVVLLGLCLSIGLNASFAATITGGSQEAIVGGHWTSNYGSDGYALFGTAPNNDVPGIFSPSGGQTVFDFSAQLSNGQTAQTLLSVPSYVNGLTSLQLTSIKEGYNYTLIDNPLGGAQIASGNAFLSNAPPNQSTSLFSFDVNGLVPSAFAFTVFLNNEAAVPASLTFSDSSQSATISVGNLTSFDAFTFNVTGALAGDNFSLSALAGLNGSIDISGVAFQTEAVPEPPTPVLLTASFALIGLVYRLTSNGDVVAFKMGRRQGGPSRQ